MKLDLIFEGDTITEYLDKLQSNANNEEKKKKPLNDIAEEIVEMVDEVIPQWNPNLIYSGHNKGHWRYSFSTEQTSLEVLYTGMSNEAKNKQLSKGVWWEFGKYHKGGTEDILERDYAYYQEMGEDIFATDEKYKAPTFSGHHFIDSAVADSIDVVEYHVEEYLDSLMRLR